jgi:hypothetical protein
VARWLSPPRLDDADENVTRLAALSPRLADIAVAIHSGAMTRVEAAKALLEVVDPSTLTSDLVLEVLHATDAYEIPTHFRDAIAPTS